MRKVGWGNECCEVARGVGVESGVLRKLGVRFRRFFVDPRLPVLTYCGAVLGKCRRFLLGSLFIASLIPNGGLIDDSIDKDPETSCDSNSCF